MDYQVEVKSLNDNTAVIKGYGIVFGGRDRSKNGDTFTPATDLHLKRLIGTPVYIEHTLTGFTKSIGEIINYGVDKFGVWVEAKIDTSLAIVKDYLSKIAKGLVGWSSGSVGHLVDRVKNVITNWPIAELSLTTDPAEPRTLGVEQIKSLNPKLASILEAEQESREEEKANQEEENTVNINRKGNYTMDENTLKSVTDMVKDAELKAKEAAKAEFDAELKRIQETKDAEDKRQAELKAAREEGRKDAEAEFKSVKPIGLVVKSKVGDADNDALQLYNRYLMGDLAVKSMLETTAGSAPAVPVEMVNSIFEKVAERSVVRAMGAQIRNVEGYQFDAVRVVTGTAQPTYTAEGGAISAAQPNYDKLTVTLYDFKAYIPVSRRALADSNFNLVAHLSGEIGKAIAARENNAFINGSGSNEPFGVLTRSVLGVTAASTGTMTYNEILSLIGSVHEDYATVPTTAFLVKRSVLYSSAMLGLTQANYLVFQPTPVSVPGTVPGRTGAARLHGVPVWDCTEMPATTTGQKVLLFGDFGQYVIGQKAGGPEILRNDYEDMNHGMVRFYFETRLGGDLPQTAAVKHLILA